MVDMDNVVYAMKEMASQLEKINEIAYDQYKPIVLDLCNRVVPLDEVEHTLGRMLDFCGNEAF